MHKPANFNVEGSIHATVVSPAIASEKIIIKSLAYLHVRVEFERFERLTNIRG